MHAPTLATMHATMHAPTRAPMHAQSRPNADGRHGGGPRVRGEPRRGPLRNNTGAVSRRNGNRHPRAAGLPRCAAARPPTNTASAHGTSRHGRAPRRAGISGCGAVPAQRAAATDTDMSAHDAESTGPDNP